MKSYPAVLAAALVLGLPPGGAVAQPADPHPEWNVLYGHPGFDDIEDMLPGYLRKAVSEAHEERRRAIAGLQDRAEAERYQRTVRERLLEALGSFPERTPLNAVTTGRIERGGYAVEKVVFESRPRYYVTANVYAPRQVGARRPAVLCPVGHWGDGKAFEDYQRLGIYLARRGFVVLVYDVPGQGERLQYYSPVMGRSLIDPGGSTFFVTIEHGLAGAQSILATGDYASYLLWDGIRALDYLVERPDVDAERIACTGTSGGGLQAEVLSALDDRIKVSIPVCYGGCNPDNPVRPGFAIDDIDALIAPRPALMIEATGDARSGVLAKQRRQQAVARVYELLGAGDRTRYLIAEGPHGYGENMRQEAYRWLARWFGMPEPTPESLAEPPTAIESESALAATATGQVRTALGGETIASLARATLDKLRGAVSPPGSRAQRREWRDSLRQTVAARLGYTPETSPLDARVLTRVDRGGYVLEKIVYRSEPEIVVPALLFLPKSQERRTPVIFVNEAGKSAGDVVEQYLRPLTEEGRAMLAIDPRGMGETAPLGGPPSSRNSYRGLISDAETRMFYDALRVGKTLPGLRSLDVRRAIDYLESRPDVGRGAAVIGHGIGGLTALYAAALDDRVEAVAVNGSLISYRDIVEGELYTHSIGSFVPGALRGFDLPDVAALIAPRRLLILNAVDHRHQRVELERLKAAHDAAARVFGLAEAARNLTLGNAASSGEVLEAYQNHFGP